MTEVSISCNRINLYWHIGSGRRASLGEKGKISVRCQEPPDAQTTVDSRSFKREIDVKIKDTNLAAKNLLMI